MALIKGSLSLFFIYENINKGKVNKDKTKNT